MGGVDRPQMERTEKKRGGAAAGPALLYRYLPSNRLRECVGEFFLNLLLPSSGELDMRCCSKVQGGNSIGYLAA